MSSLTAQRRLDLSNYVMVWNDEFDYTGTQTQVHYQMFDAPNAKWLDGFSYYKPFTGGGGTNEPLRIIRKKNVTVSSGTLKLKAQFDTEDPIVDNYTVWKGTTYSSKHSTSVITANYDSDYYCPKGWDENDDGINDNQIGFNYGIFEIRAKLPRKIGDYSAYWFWANPYQCGNDLNSIKCSDDSTAIDYHPLYTGLEIDVFEAKQIGNGIDNFVWWGSQLPNKLSNCTDCRTYYDWKFSDPEKEFHTYTFAWAPNKMTWFIDGNEIRTEENGIPPYKMDLILSMTGWADTSHDYEIDYVRVYRPVGVDYTATPFYQGTQYQGDYIWTDRGDPDRLQYENTFTNTPYFANENYRKVANGPQVQNYAGLLALEYPDALAVHNLNNNNSRIYYTKNNGKIYLVNNTGTSFSNPSTVVTGDVHISTNIAVHPQNGQIYWKSPDNRLKVRYQSGTTWYTSYVDVSYQYPNDVFGNITVSPPNSEHDTRVYYISTNNNQLCYYEYCNGWYRHETPITAVAEFAISSDPQGKIFYRGLDNHIWVIWKFWDDNTPCNSNSPVSDWNYGPLDYPYASTFADCAGSLAVTLDGSKVFYKTTTGDLAYRTVSGNHQRFLADVNDVAGDIVAGETPDGRTEIFYVAKSTINGVGDKIKTYYERKAPLLNTTTLWQSGTLDVFSPGQGGNGLGASYNTGFYVDKYLAINPNAVNKVFCFYNHSGHPVSNKYLGAYIASTNWSSIPPPYENCSEETGWHNGFEGKQINPNIVNNEIPHNDEIRLNENKESEVLENSVFPNPTTGQITVQLKSDWCGAIIRVIDWTGRTISVQNDICQSIEIDLSEYPKGIYLIQINYNEELETKKILKN
jgi:beta-glucanase (GH16 family)